MAQTNLTDAKAKLSELVERAAGGEDIVILRNGRPRAKIVAYEAKLEPIDVEEMRRIRSGIKMQPVDSGRFVRAMRDDGY
jgi:prevent-host-death family protein